MQHTIGRQKFRTAHNALYHGRCAIGDHRCVSLDSNLVALERKPAFLRTRVCVLFFVYAKTIVVHKYHTRYEVPGTVYSGSSMVPVCASEQYRHVDGNRHYSAHYHTGYPHLCQTTSQALERAAGTTQPARVEAPVMYHRYLVSRYMGVITMGNHS